MEYFEQVIFKEKFPPVDSCPHCKTLSPMNEDDEKSISESAPFAEVSYFERREPLEVDYSK